MLKPLQLIQMHHKSDRTIPRLYKKNNYKVRRRIEKKENKP
jgi:hypothetical protein